MVTLLAATGLNGMPVYTSVGIALAVCIIGLLIYLLPTPPKPNEVGRLLFFAGALVALIRAGVAAFIVT